MAEWIDIERAPTTNRGSQVPRLTLSGQRLHLSVAAVRQLRESAGLGDDNVLRIQVRTNPEKTKLAVTVADVGGLVVTRRSGHTSGSRLRSFLGNPPWLVRMDLEWDAGDRMFVGEIPTQA